MDFYESGGAKKTMQIEVFQFEKKALLYVRVPGTQNCDPRLKRLQNISFLESSVNFLIEGLQSLYMLKQIYYQRGAAFRSSCLVGGMSWTVFLLHFRLKISAKSKREVV